MGQYINNGKVTLGEEYDYDDAVAEIAGLLAVAPRSDGMYRLADICQAGSINMWSAHKPIEYPKNAALTDAEFRGTTAQNQQNIYYGIKVDADVSSNLTSESVSEIHDATFEYVAKPTGVIDVAPNRIRDFDGYNHYTDAALGASWPDGTSKPSLLGDWDDYADIGGSLQGIYVGYNPQSDGVDFSAMLLDPSVSIDYILQRAYPCILVTDNAGRSWFTALYNSAEGGYVPLLYNGQYITHGDWRVMFSKGQYNPNVNIGNNTSPWNADTLGLKASIFLFRSASDTEPLLTSAGGNFGTYWISLSSAGTNGTYKPAVIPGALGATLDLKRIAVVFGAAVGVSGIIGSQSTIVNVRLVELTNFDSKNTITVECRVNLNGESKSSTETFDGWTAGQDLGPGFIFGFSRVPVPGGDYSGTVRIITTDGNRTSIEEESFSGTYN